MSRTARIIIPNALYHILNRGNNKEVIFFDDEDFKFFLKQIRKYKEKFKIKIYHYCLMPNHYHFLLQAEDGSRLAGFMQGLDMVYAQNVKRKYGKVGHIWQGRYKSPLIESEKYLGRCGYYIEDNPRRAKLVEKLEDWPWLSYHFYAYGKEDPIVDIDADYLKLGATPGERQENYRKFIMEAWDEDWLRDIRKRMNQGILGSEKFVKEMEEKFKIKLKKTRRRTGTKE